jgi:hypothetical protein
MEFRPLYLISYFAAIAFLLAWLAGLAVAFYWWSRKDGLRRFFAGPRIALRHPGQNSPWNNILLAISGAVFGTVVISWVGDWSVREWLLLILTGLAILCHELLLTKKDLDLLAILALLASLYDQREIGPDLFERLVKVVDGLPVGEVQKAAREVLQRRRSGQSVEQCCQAFSGLHPLLDELVFTLHLAGGQASPAFDLALERLTRRAARQWDRISRSLVFRENIKPFVTFSQAALLAVLAVLLVEDIPALKVAWPSYAVISWIGVGCILVAGVLYAAGSRPWLRRVLGAALMLASLLPLWQSASLPGLYELQLQSVTYSSTADPNEQVGWQLERKSGFEEANANPVLQTRAVLELSSPRSTVTPTSPQPSENRSQPSATLSQSQEVEPAWILPCCTPR